MPVATMGIMVTNGHVHIVTAMACRCYSSVNKLLELVHTVAAKIKLSLFLCRHEMDSVSSCDGNGNGENGSLGNMCRCSHCSDSGVLS